MFLARRNSGCFKLLIETLPKGHFNLSTRVNIVAQGRRCSIWQGAWEEFGWFLARFVLLLPWTGSSPQPCDLLAAHRAWSLHSAACLNALTEDSLACCTWAGIPAAKQPRVTRQRLSGDSAACPAAGGRTNQRVSPWLEALQPQGCCICLGSDVAGWISVTEFSVTRSECFIPFISHGTEIIITYK